MKKSSLIALVLVLGVVFAGWVSTIEGANEDEKGLGRCDLVQNPDDYERLGKIMDFTEEGVHVLVGDMVITFQIDAEKTKDFYLGEVVRVTKVNYDEFELGKYELKDFDTRYTITGDIGELILRTSGTVKEVNEDKFTITAEGRDLKFRSDKSILLQRGAKVIVEYVEKEDGNILVDFYNEASKLDLIVKDIRRMDNTGQMLLSTESKDGMKYHVYILATTVLNCNYSDFKVDDEIEVYADFIRESYPAQVDAKMINR